MAQESLDTCQVGALIGERVVTEAGVLIFLMNCCI